MPCSNMSGASHRNIFAREMLTPPMWPPQTCHVRGAFNAPWAGFLRGRLTHNQEG
jgi:hypothetical protein